MKKTIFLLTVAAIGLSVIGCISLKQQYNEKAEGVIELINEGKADKLADMTQTPFLLDGEIVILKQDTVDFWNTIVRAGFKIKDPSYVEAFPANEETYKEFARTMEVETYFKKYISDKGHVVVIETDKFKLLLLMDQTKKGKMRIIGFKGPDAV